MENSRNQISIHPKDDVMSLLAPYLKAMRDCVERGHSDLKSIRDDKPELYAKLSKRAKSTLMNDFTTTQAVHEFSGNQKIRLMFKYGSLRLIYESPERCVHVRFKKLNKNGQVSAILTKTFNDYMSQQPGLGGINFGAKPAVNLICAWLFDQFEIEVSSVIILCPFGKTRLWDYEIPSSVPIPQPVPRLKDQTETGIEIQRKGETKRQKQEKKSG